MVSGSLCQHSDAALSLPCTCARGKVIGLSICCHRHENYQISRYRHLRALQAWPECGEKLAWFCFKSTTQARITTNVALCVDHAYQPHLPLTTCFLLMRTTTQQVSSMQIGKMQIQCAGYVLLSSSCPYYPPTHPPPHTHSCTLSLSLSLLLSLTLSLPLSLSLSSSSSSSLSLPPPALPLPPPPVMCFKSNGRETTTCEMKTCCYSIWDHRRSGIVQYEHGCSRGPCVNETRGKMVIMWLISILCSSQQASTV